MEPSDWVETSAGTAGACGGKNSSPGGAPSAAGTRCGGMRGGCWPAGKTGGGAVVMEYKAAWPTGGGATVVGYKAAWPAGGTGGGAEVAGCRAACVSPWEAGAGGSPTDQPCRPDAS